MITENPHVASGVGSHPDVASGVRSHSDVASGFSRTSSIVTDHVASSVAAAAGFFDANSRIVSQCCQRMAAHFARGGTLLVMAEGAQASDAQHVAVEFVHPVIVGKRALPAVSVTADADVCPADILLALCANVVAPQIAAALDAARTQGALTVLVRGSGGSRPPLAEFDFMVPEDDALVIQEVSETLYHVLWELVHVFIDAADVPKVAFLPATPRAADELIAEVQASTQAKAREICALRSRVGATEARRLQEAGRAIAARLERNGKLLACGNGGSATDAQDLAADCRQPARPGWRRLPAMALTSDIGIITAIGNDVGFEHVFSRQIIAFGHADDIAVAFSTSGASRNLVAAMAEARTRGLLTIAMSGGDGGELARPGVVDYCFTVESEQLPRIQEVHATMWHALLSVVQEERR